MLDRLLEDLHTLGCTSLGTAAADPSMTFKYIEPDGTPSWPLAVYSGTNPRLYLNFAWIAPNRPDLRAAFLDAVGDLGGTLDVAKIRAADLKKRPGVPLRVLLDPELYDRVLAAMRLLTI